MKLLPKSFYVHIAHLFYAVAMIDNKMERDEKLRIIDFVKIYWSNSIGSTTGEEIIYITLRELIVKKIKAPTAYDSFEAYYKTNIILFDDTLKANLLKSCRGITNSLIQKRKSEIIILTKLALLFRDKSLKF